MRSLERLWAARWTWGVRAAWIAATAWMAVGCHSEVAAAPENGAPVSAANGAVATVNVPVDAKTAESAPKKHEAPPVEDAPEAMPPKPISEEDDEGEPGGVVGGVVGGVPGGVVGGVLSGVPGGVLGGVPGGVVGGTLGPDAVRTVSDPELTQTSCPKLSGTPPYPKEARDAQIETVLIAKCVIEKSGALTCEMIKTHPLFEQPLLAYLKKQKVTPFTLKDGTKTRVRCVYPFRFKIR